MIKIISNTIKKYCVKIVSSLTVLLSGILFFSTAYALDLGTVANTVTGTFGDLTRLLTAGSYVAGIGFAIGAIMKFKQHKDNPTQIPVGTPIALIFIAAALIFLPTILGVTGATLFGTQGSVGGPYGTVFLGT